MSALRHEFHPGALAEYEEAARFYADQQPDLDLRFITAVEDAIARVCEAPERWRVFDGDEVRRHLTRVFPYGILYSVEADHVLIAPWPIVAGSRATGDTAHRRAAHNPVLGSVCRPGRDPLRWVRGVGTHLLHVLNPTSVLARACR